VGYVARVDEIRCSYKISAGKMSRKNHLGNIEVDGSIKIDIKERVCVDMNWIYLILYRQK
jgi:hypothetical protein